MEEKPEDKNYNVDYAKSYYLNNREKILNYQKKYYEDNNKHRKKRVDKNELKYKIKNNVFIISFN